MDAIRKIEAALAAGPTETEWRPLVTRIDDARGYQICHFDLHGKSEKERDANRALVVACQPSAIREVLQTLASKEAELVRLRSLLARYRNETPLGHQPHMIAEEVDAALTQPPKEPT